MQKAGFWKLCTAYLIDGVVCQIVGFVAGFIAGAIVGALLGAAGLYTPQTMPTFMLIVRLVGWVAGLLVLILYFAFSECKFGKTIGKKLMGIAVVKDVPAKEENN